MTIALELCFYLGKKCSRSKHPETTSLLRYWILILVNAFLITTTYSAHLWLTEKWLSKHFSLDFFKSLLLKYFVGNSEIFLVPFLIIFIDPNMSRGLKYIFNVRKNASNNSVPTQVWINFWWNNNYKIVHTFNKSTFLW